MIATIDARMQSLARVLAGLVRWRRSWALVAAAVLGLVTGLAVLSALGRHLGAMHLPGTESMGLDQRAGPAGLDRVVSSWRRWFDANSDAGFRSPRALAGLWLAVDTFLVIPGYTLGALFVLLREHERSPSRRPVLLPTLRWSAALVLVLAAADVLENALTGYLVNVYWSGTRSSSGAIDAVLGVVATVKWIAGLGVMVPVVLVLVVALRSTAADTRTGLWLLRGHLLVAAIGLAAFLAPVQLPDLIVRWNAAQAGWTAASAGVAAVTIWATGGLALELHARGYGARGRIKAARWWRLAAIALATWLARAAIVNLLAGGDAMAPLVPLIAAAVLYAAGLPLRAGGAATDPIVDGDISVTARAVPRALAAGLVVAVGIAALQAWTALYVQRDDPWLVFAVGVALVAGGLAALLVLRRLDGRLAGRGYATGALAAAVATLVVVAILLGAPTTAPTSVGGVGIALVFLAATTVALSTLISMAGGWAATYGMPAALTVVGIRRRIPVLTFLLLWGVVAASLDDASHWDVRTTRSGGTDGLAVEDAVADWIDRAQERAPVATAPDAARVPTPLVMVASSGGGIRSAYWTALALDCLFLGVTPRDAGGQAPSSGTRAPCRPTGDGAHTAEPGDVFLASGISGGSLGLVEWDARLAAGESDDDWVEERLGADFLAPSLARGLLVEVPRSWLHFDAAGRADVIEEAWERGWGEPGPGNPLSQPFLASQADRGERPLLVLNGASVFDGCALNVSVLQAGATGDQRLSPPAAVPRGDCTSVDRYLTAGASGPGPLPATADVLDYLTCDAHRDVRRSTAALLSARFPYVSPAGRLAACGRGSSTKFIVDGGYVDTSAAESAVTLWQSIEPLVEDHNRTSQRTCLVPYFVQLDNSYLSTTSPPDKENPPNQLVAPAIALWQTTGLASRAERARAHAAHLFTQRSPWVADDERARDRYALLAPRNHPGAKAPLGWTLADASRRDLERELYRGNAESIRTVRSWLEDPPPCRNAGQ